MFVKRLGSNVRSNRLSCAGGCNCPDILEMESGDYAIIGTDITEQARDHLLAGSGCGPDEKIVRVPREVLVLARAEIPATA